MQRKIRRRCKCGCGNITNYGKRYVHGHAQKGKKFSEEHKKKLSLIKKGKKFSKEHKKKIGLAHKGMKRSKETKLKISLSKLQCNPNYPYCDIWRDKEYRKDLHKNYCENINCKNNYIRLCLHHIYLDKKRCAPKDIITLCNPCHMVLHAQLQKEWRKPTNPKHYIIINRPDHVSYIHKESREITIIKKEATQ